MKTIEEIVTSSYYKKVLDLIKSVLPVIIYPNEAESLAVKICGIKQSDPLPDVGNMIQPEPPLEIKICTRCHKEFKSEINNPVCPSCYL